MDDKQGGHFLPYHREVSPRFDGEAQAWNLIRIAQALIFIDKFAVKIVKISCAEEFVVACRYM